MTRFFLYLSLAGFAGCGFPVMGGYGSPDIDTNDTEDTNDDDDDDDDDTNDDDPSDGDGGGWVVDQNGDQIAHVDDCDLTEDELKTYRDGARAFMAYTLDRSTGTYWAHGELGADTDEIPSDFYDWNLEGAFRASSSERVCAIVFRWDDDGPFVRSSTTAIPSMDYDLDDEPFAQEAVDLGARWPGEGMSDAQAQLTVTAVAYVGGAYVQVIPDYWCWPGEHAGCGTGLIALHPDHEEYEDDLYRSH